MTDRNVNTLIMTSIIEEVKKINITMTSLLTFLQSQNSTLIRQEKLYIDLILSLVEELKKMNVTNNTLIDLVNTQGTQLSEFIREHKQSKNRAEGLLI